MKANKGERTVSWKDRIKRKVNKKKIGIREDKFNVPALCLSRSC